MSNRVNWKKAFIQAAAVGLILCAALAVIISGIIFVNYDNMGRLTRVVHLIDKYYLNETEGADLVEGAIKGMVSSLDKYSSYQDAEENEKLMNSIQGTFGGIGVHLSTADPTKLVVMRPIKGSPAERAGLQAGDIILKIDDTDVSEISSDTAVAILRGEPGTKVSVTIYRPGTSKEFVVSMIRDNINVPTVEGQALPGHPDIALIDISSFSMQTGDELENVLKEMDIDKYNGVIIDLRYNPGGEVNAAIKVASLLVPANDGPIVHIVDNKGNIDTRRATADYINKPIVLLINEYSASASEIVSGAVKDYGAGILVGTKTYGKGVVQTVFELDGNTSVKLTTDKYLTPLKNDINKIGVEPDVKVELKEDEKATILPNEADFDSQLTKGIEALGQMIQ
ncbi:S41 family peptidase [Dehalobacter sp. DCM]|uniref:S41 family peptidase n=1 Tax=Dehalobacter sp. DCM TaxID=2907827 RepID=UPI003081CFE0|nr:S41 family peptidase [Dehalobacter sp. DCM]